MSFAVRGTNANQPPLRSVRSLRAHPYPSREEHPRSRRISRVRQRERENFSSFEFIVFRSWRSSRSYISIRVIDPSMPIIRFHSMWWDRYCSLEGNKSMGSRNFNCVVDDGALNGEYRRMGKIDGGREQMVWRVLEAKFSNVVVVLERETFFVFLFFAYVLLVSNFYYAEILNLSNEKSRR